MKHAQFRRNADTQGLGTSRSKESALAAVLCTSIALGLLAATTHWWAA